MIEIFNMDCMELMRSAKDKQWDLAIVDPPYGIGDFTRNISRRKAINRKYRRAVWNDSIPSDEYFEELNRVSSHRIIWGANYYNCFESGALIWDKGNEHPDMSSCEIASCSIISTVQRLKYFYTGFTEVRIHPCQKPIALYKWLLKNYAKPGWKILDTHLGSGSIAIACHDYGYDLTACELDKDYYEAAVKRLKQHQAQLSFV